MAHKYPIHKDFHLLKYLHMPFNRVVLTIANFFLSLMYHLEPNPKGVIKKRIRVVARDGYPVKVDVFIPRSQSAPLPAIVYFPGGGFVMAATHVHRYNLTRIVRELSLVGIMVHYRLAPKYAFPTAFFDAIDILEYLNTNHNKWQIQKDKIILAGDSAGGNLAAGVSLFEKDHHQATYPQMLVYPALNRGFESESRRLFQETPMLRRSTLENVAKVYFQNGTQGLEQYAIPCLHPQMAGLGPCYIETAEFDPLRDDGRCYYQKLIEAGVKASLRETKGTVHGYDVIRKSPIVLQSINERHAFIRAILSAKTLDHQ